MDAAVDEVISKAKGARGRKDKDKEDGAVIKVKTLKEALRELGECKVMADEVAAKLKAAVKAVAEKSGLLSSVVRAMVKAQSGDSDQYADAARKVEQLAIVFDEIGYQGEITKAAAQ